MRPQTHHTASVTHHCSLLLETAAERLGTLRSRRWERAQEVAWLACVSFGDRQQRRATPEHWFREAMERSSRVGGGGGSVLAQLLWSSPGRTQGWPLPAET